MNKAILLHTLGNRDIQFRTNAPLPGDFVEKCLDTNTEDPHYYVLKKGRKEGQPTFREICKIIKRRSEDHNEKKLFQEAMEFPMLAHTCAYVLKEQDTIQNIWLYATSQPRPFHQDTDVMAPFAAAYLEQNFPNQIVNIHIEYRNMSPKPSDRTRILSMFHEDLVKFNQSGFTHIYINNNQGLPQATAALNFLGLFQPYKYLQPGKDTSVEPVSHSQKEEILESLVKNRLFECLPEAGLKAEHAELIRHFVQSLQLKR